jgi:TolB-like protein/class 3 adenylate cyclase/tetratricopeptide (TPR) repeat protein
MAGDRVERRLAAVLAADVAGYSRLMGLDEVGTARALREHRAITDALVAKHGGRLVKSTGDGVLLEFPSVVDAVECAVAVQAIMTERNEGVSVDRRMLFRIGINLGDILIEGDDILGDGVNIAARLESIAEPGGICISSSAYDQVRGKVAVEFTDLGEQSLKNIARPVRTYAVLRDALRTTTRDGCTMPRPPSAPRLSIVVLPFANMSGDPEQDYFVDGVTESLTTDLSRINEAFVIARNTAFTFKGKPVNVRQVGRELNVRYVLEGSVQRGGNRMRVNVQLIEAETGSHLWAERFDYPVTDLFVMQDEIVARLAYTLNVQLTNAEARRALVSNHPDAMDLYFQGRALLNKEINLGHLKQARAFLEGALLLDPGNVEALYSSAVVDLHTATGYFTDDWSAFLSAGERVLTKVLSLAPDHAQAHGILGVFYMNTDRVSQGIAELKRALELDRNLAWVHGTIGQAKYFIGQAEETESHVREALRLSPRDHRVYLWYGFVGAAKFWQSADTEAVSWFRRSIEANRNFATAHFHLAAALACVGELDEARALAQSGLALNPSFTIRRHRASAACSHPAYLAGRLRLHEGMRMAGVPEG